MSLNFRKKLFLSYGVVLVLPLIVLGFYSYYIANSYLIQLERKDLSENVDKISANLNYKFNKFNSAMEFVTTNPGFIEIFNKPYTDMFLQYKNISDVVVPTLETVQGLDRDIKNLAVCTNNDFPELSGAIMRMDSVQGYWKDLPVALEKSNWYVEGGRLMGVRGMLKQYKSSFDSMFCLELDYEHVFSDVNIDKQKPYEALLVDSAGNVVFKKNNLPGKEVDFTSREVLESSSDVVTVDGEQFLQLRTEIPAAKWQMYFYIPIKAITIDAGKTIFTTLSITGICLLILMWIVWLFSGVFLRRINDLNTKMKIVEEGNLKVEIHSDSKDEIGDLVNGVGSMLKSINQLVDEVYQKSLKEKELEIKLLQSKINPHFLYNTLSMINWKAIKIKADDISYIITTLSKYYRTTLNKGRNITTVREEIDNITSYIDIQYMMHSGSFETEYEVDQSVLGCRIPNLTLQPIVENAIEHGIDKKLEGKGKIKISARAEEGVAIFSIEDNGPGMPEEMASQVLTHQAKGYGIKNVNERIKLIFGEEFGLRIGSVPGRGTRVEVRIPMREDFPEQTEGSSLS